MSGKSEHRGVPKTMFRESVNPKIRRATPKTEPVPDPKDSATQKPSPPPSPPEPPRGRDWRS